ncbi:Crp/Fnr family transcriptional regulator [Vallitalea guaymasensis]|uniref:Crp/Fnr family transcriptional regulator n=1 Tax=Vallitalea guaymasensis TaxID=1185412 RepID=UPI000DE4181A|nr:Crp/Fnr family transcriptional regulator [Vallitalea guaymasensis]
MEKYINILSSCPLFKNKSKKEIIDTLSKTKYKIITYHKNDFIFRADESPIYIGIVLSGSIEVQNNLKSGKYFNVLYKNKGEVFGGALAFSDIPISKFDVIAKTKCDIMLISRQSVLDVLFKDSIIAYNIMNTFAKSVMKLNKKVELFSYSSIKQKIAYSLLCNLKPDENIINLPYSKKAWAEHLNVSRSSLSRELKDLIDKGIIKINNKQIQVLKKDQLEYILDDI